MARRRLDDLASEYVGAEFGDARLTRRLVGLATALGHEPAASFPVASDSDAEREGTYRFLGNVRVTPEQITAPHMRATVERIGDGPVVASHDTTEFNYGASERDDLGRVGQGQSHGRERHADHPGIGHPALGPARKFCAQTTEPIEPTPAIWHAPPHPRRVYARRRQRSGRSGRSLHLGVRWELHSRSSSGHAAHGTGSACRYGVCEQAGILKTGREGVSR